MSKNKGKTAEELLQQALVPEEEWPYPIPENWVWVIMGDIGLYHNGRAFKSNEWSNSGKPIIRIQDLTGTNKGRPNYYDGIIDQRHEIKKGDFLISWSATLGAYLWEKGNAVLNQHIFKVESFINQKYHYYYTKNIIGTLYKNTHGSGMVHVTKQLFNSMPVPLPPVNEQNRIADKVERFLNKINQAKQLIEETKEAFELRRAAILDKAFRGELTEKWRSDNDVAFDWEFKKLGDLVKFGPQNGLYKPKDAYGDGTLIVRIDSFYNGEIKDWGTLKRLHLEGNEMNLYGLEDDDVIINRVNSIEYLGKSALVRNLIEPAVFESNVMRLKLNERIVPEFLILYLNSFKGLEELRKNAKHAVNQASINQQDVKNVTVPLPTKREQIELIRLLNSIIVKEMATSECIDLTEKVNLLENSLLSKAFRGELGTNEPNDESATIYNNKIKLSKRKD